MPCKARTTAKPQAEPPLTPARSFRDDNATVGTGATPQRDGCRRSARCWLSVTGEAMGAGVLYEVSENRGLGGFLPGWLSRGCPVGKRDQTHRGTETATGERDGAVGG